MRFHLEATPDELNEKGEELIKSLVESIAPFSHDLAEKLEKALPERKVALKDRALDELHAKTKEEYQKTVAAMLGAIGKVITGAGNGLKEYPERIERTFALRPPLDKGEKLDNDLDYSLDNDLVKDFSSGGGERPGHKYIKREGEPGNYEYTYADGSHSHSPGGKAGQVPETAQPQTSMHPSLVSHASTFQSTPVSEQHAQYFKDANTGLLNERGADAQPHDPQRPMTARFSMEGFKALNDKFGHDVPDGALRLMANVLSAQIPDGIKRGGDLEGDVRDQAHAQEIANAMATALDPSGRIKVTVTAVPRGEDHKATLEKLDTKHKAFKDAEVKAGRLGDRLKVPKYFEGHPNPDEAMKPIADAMGAAKAGQNAKLTESHAQAYQQIGPEEAFKRIHTEDTGLLTNEGFQKTLADHPDHFAVSADLRGIGIFNKFFGRDATDEIMWIFNRVIAKHGGDMHAAHLHGDEYAAHHADEKTMRDLFSKIKERTDKIYLIMDIGNGKTIVKKGLQFAYGLNKDFTKADKEELPRAKKEQGDVTEPETIEADELRRRIEKLESEGYDIARVGGKVRKGSGGNDGSVEKGSGGTPSESRATGTEQVTKAEKMDNDLQKAGGPYIGPRGGKWADSQHTIAWKEQTGHAAIPGEIHEQAHSAVKDEVIPAANRAVAVGADPSSLKYVGAGGEGIIFTDKSGWAYRVLRTDDPAKREEKVKVEQDAVAALKGTPAEKYMAPQFHVDPKQGVIVRAMIEGHPGGWGTKGLREAFEVIETELNKQDFSSPEYKEDSFIVPDDGGPPVMVDIGFLHLRGKREAKQVTEIVNRGDPAAIDLLDQPFAIRNLYYDGVMGLKDALSLTAKIKDLKPDWSENDYKNHIATLQSTAKDKGEELPQESNPEAAKKAGLGTEREPKSPEVPEKNTKFVYHVVGKDWKPGDPLIPFSSQHSWDSKTAKKISKKWDEYESDPYSYYQTEGTYVHFHSTLKEAQEHKEELAPKSRILKIDTTGLEISAGKEYPHPTSYNEVPASSIEIVNLKKPKAGPALTLTPPTDEPKKRVTKRTPVKAKPNPETAPLPGQKFLFDKQKEVKVKPSQLAMFGGVPPEEQAKPDTNPVLPGQKKLF